MVIKQVDHTNVINPILLDKGIRSLLGVPLIVAGNVLGVLHVGTLTSRDFTEDDAQLLQVAGDRIALATQARLSRAEQAAARALQRSLLPTRFPVLPGLELAARYLPSKHHDLGGDWYDVFLLPSGRLAVAIGDAMGHGLRAAVVMSRLRSALRAYAIESEQPADVLTRLDRKLRYFEPDEVATVLYGIFEPSFDHVEFSSAGHPAPVLAHPGGTTVQVELVTDPPLGTPMARPRRSMTVEVPPGGLLLSFTDGLIERRGTPLDRQLTQLAASVFAGPPEAVCTDVIADFLGDEAPTDDAAVLAIRRHPAHRRPESPQNSG
jgi:serine phosphatase RsbU (regulator of sigma subunit)